MKFNKKYTGIKFETPKETAVIYDMASKFLKSDQVTPDEKCIVEKFLDMMYVADCACISKEIKDEEASGISFMMEKIDEFKAKYC